MGKAAHETLSRGMRLKITRAMLCGLSASEAGKRYGISKSGAFWVYQQTVGSFFLDHEKEGLSSIDDYRRKWREIGGHCPNH